MKQKTADIQGTMRLMGALGRMPPKPHEEMKLGKPKAKRAASPKGRKKASKQKRARVKDSHDRYG